MRMSNGLSYSIFGLILQSGLYCIIELRGIKRQKNCTSRSMVHSLKYVLRFDSSVLSHRFRLWHGTQRRNYDMANIHLVLMTSCYAKNQNAIFLGSIIFDQCLFYYLLEFSKDLNCIFNHNNKKDICYEIYSKYFFYN